MATPPTVAHQQAVAVVRAYEVFELYKKGVSSSEIAKKLNISETTVFRDIRRVIKTINKEFALDIAEMKIMARSKLESLFKECVEGYEKSKEYSVKKVKKLNTSKESGEIAEIEIAHGDVRFLQLAKDIIDTEANLFGLNPQAPSGNIAAIFETGAGGGEVTIKTVWNTPAEQHKNKQIEPPAKKPDIVEIEDEDIEVIDEGDTGIAS